MKLGLLPGTVSGSGGPSTYVTGLIRSLDETAPEIEVHGLLLGLNQARWRARTERAQTAALLSPDGRVAVYGRPASARLYRSVLHPLLPSYDLLFGRHDVYHQTHLDVDPPVPGRKLILTLHDLIAEHWPDEGSLLENAERLLGRAAAVITVSAASRDGIISRFPSVSPDRVHVIWNGVDHDVFHSSTDNQDVDLLQALGVTPPYLLYAGGLTGRKNVGTLIAAHQLLTRQENDVPPLLLVGPWKRERLADVEAGDGAVRTMGDVPARAVPALMRHATAVVLPSREEGFGLPLLEAQACGTVVICSDIAVFREIGGDSPIYVDSTSAEVLAADLHHAIGRTPEDLAARRELGLRHAMDFSWHRSASAHAEVYQRVASEAVSRSAK